MTHIFITRPRAPPPLQTDYVLRRITCANVQQLIAPPAVHWTRRLLWTSQAHQMRVPPNGVAVFALVTQATAATSAAWRQVCHAESKLNERTNERMNSRISPSGRSGIHGRSIRNAILCSSPSLIYGVTNPLANAILPYPASWSIPRYLDFQCSLFQRIVPFWVTK